MMVPRDDTGAGGALVSCVDAGMSRPHTQQPPHGAASQDCCRKDVQQAGELAGALQLCNG